LITVSYYYDRVDTSLVDEDWATSICKIIFQHNNHNVAHISIIFSNDSRLHKLKKKYFGVDLLTDTITFNLEDKGDPIDGEIYISLDRVIENSKLYEQTVVNELKRVIVHSILHLLGFKDSTPNDKIKMTELEEKYIFYKIESNQI